jgi:Fur family iron response transcriptional regulator
LPGRAGILAKSLIRKGTSVTRDQIAELLTRYGVMPTSQRVDVGEVILEKPQHLSAEQVIVGVRRKGSRVSKATVYNTLNLFCRRGLLRTVNVDPSRQYYDPTVRPHHHFYNVTTGELTDIPPDAVALQIATELPPGTERDGVEVIIRVRDADVRDTA